MKRPGHFGARDPLRSHAWTDAKTRERKRPKLKLPYEWDPREYQVPFLEYMQNGGKRAVCCWHRRSGKDMVALESLVCRAHERVGVYWHCLPTYAQGMKAVWNNIFNGKRLIDSVFPPQIVKRRDESEMLIELLNGSIIQIVGSDTIDRLVGAGPVGVTFSEFSLCKPSAWNLTRPILAENGGWATFLFTPRGSNHAKELFDMAKQNSNWFAQRLTIEDTGALPLSLLEEERKSGMPEALIRQEYMCDFTAALVGSVYGDLLETIEKTGTLGTIFPINTDEVFTSWDLGFTDATAIWFWTLTPNGVDFIDYYEAHGKPLSHYFDVLQAKSEVNGYKYKKHWLPHDARQRSLGSGSSILELCTAVLGAGAVAVGPQLSLLDGIQAGRWLLQLLPRFHLRCVAGIDALREYHYDWDEDKRTYSPTPFHGWESHGADGYRYAAIVVKASKLLTAKPALPQVGPAAVPMSQAYTLDKLWKIKERSGR